MGVEVAFHTTVGDQHDDLVAAFRLATERASIILVTGGLGPTADDLTRATLAEAAGVQLEFHAEVVDHIQKMFTRYSKEMPERNKVQAWFPVGAHVIENPEGTAPGIELKIQNNGIGSQLFALPGVPAEMKQMWIDSVRPAIQALLGDEQVIHHHVIHCFGVGESQTEAMLPDMIARDRLPLVGITASSATISLSQ